MSILVKNTKNDRKSTKNDPRTCPFWPVPPPGHLVLRGSRTINPPWIPFKSQGSKRSLLGPPGPSKTGPPDPQKQWFLVIFGQFWSFLTIFGVIFDLPGGPGGVPEGSRRGLRVQFWAGRALLTPSLDPPEGSQGSPRGVLGGPRGSKSPKWPKTAKIDYFRK